MSAESETAPKSERKTGSDWNGFGRQEQPICVVDEDGEIVKEDSVGTTKKAMAQLFSCLPRCPGRNRSWDAFAVGESLAQEPGVCSDGSEFAERAVD